MKLKFNGIVELGDSYRVTCEDDGKDGAIWIGGKDVVSEIGEAKFNKPVTVAIADETFNGDLEVEEGWGYSEWTPMDEDVLKVGTHDLIEILQRYEGKEITMWIANEPVNVLE